MKKLCGFSFVIKVMLFLLVLISIFATLWIRSAIISTEYRLSNLEQQKKELLKERRILVAEKASLTSFVRIDTANHEIVLPDRKKVFFIQINPETLIQSVSYRKEK